MNCFTRICVVLTAISSVMLTGFAPAQFTQKSVSGEDLVYVPAINEGLCVQSLFQSNMVLQREKPISIWGWANPGETVTVTLYGKAQSATAAADRSWKVTLQALPPATRR